MVKLVWCGISFLQAQGHLFLVKGTSVFVKDTSKSKLKEEFMGIIQRDTKVCHSLCVGNSRSSGKVFELTFVLAKFDAFFVQTQPIVYANSDVL